jgi:hypothetical protein
MTKVRRAFNLEPILVMKIKREAARLDLTQSDWAAAAFAAALANDNAKPVRTETRPSPINLHSIGIAFALWVILGLIIWIGVGIGRGL